MIKKNTLPVILSILIAICLGNITNMHTSFRNNQRFPIYKLPNAGQITPKNIVQQTIADTIKNQHSPQSWPLYQNKNTTHRIPFKPIPSTSKVKYFSTVPTVQNTNKMSLTMPEQLDKTQLIIPELPKEPSIKETSNIENLLKKNIVTPLSKNI